MRAEPEGAAADVAAQRCGYEGRGIRRPEIRDEAAAERHHGICPAGVLFSTAASDAQRREIYSGKLPSDGQWNRIEHDLAISPQLRTGDTGVTAEARHYGYVSYVKFTASTVHDVEFSIWSNGYNLTTLERRLDANRAGKRSTGRTRCSCTGWTQTGPGF